MSNNDPNTSHLCITLKEGEHAMVGDEIKITIRRVKGKEVRVLFESPRGTEIQRVMKDGTVRRRKDPVGST